MLSDFGVRTARLPQEAPSAAGSAGPSEVADVARRAGALVEQALGVTVRSDATEGAPLVGGPPSRAVSELRSLMVELVVGQRVRWRGAADGGGAVEVRAEPEAGEPAWLRVMVSFGGATRELRLPIAGATLMARDGQLDTRAPIGA